MRKLLATLCAFAFMLSALAGCQTAAQIQGTETASAAGSPAPTPSAPAPTEPSAAAPAPTEPKPQFKAGTWLATGGEVGEFFFFDADGASGRAVSLEDAAGYGFTYEQGDGKTIFHMAGAETPLPCEVVVTDEEHLTLEWEAQYAQTLTYYSPLGSDEFCFYTDEELCRMALREYEAKNGLTDSGLRVGAESGEDGAVTLQIYENLSDHNSTAAWYQVDRCTAKGTDMITGDTVELANSPVELRIELASDELLEQANAYDEYIAHDSEYQSKVVLTARIDLREFKIVSLEGVDEEGQDFQFRISEELYLPGTLSPEKPLVIGLELPETIPDLGVCYLDGSGAEKVCALSDSGLDGTPLLIEVTAAKA